MLRKFNEIRIYIYNNCKRFDITILIVIKNQNYFSILEKIEDQQFEKKYISKIITRFKKELRINKKKLIYASKFSIKSMK